VRQRGGPYLTKKGSQKKSGSKKPRKSCTQNQMAFTRLLKGTIKGKMALEGFKTTLWDDFSGRGAQRWFKSKNAILPGRRQNAKGLAGQAEKLKISSEKGKRRQMISHVENISRAESRKVLILSWEKSMGSGLMLNRRRFDEKAKSVSGPVFPWG